MGFVGLGLIAASFCFLIYRISPREWLAHIDAWKSSQPTIGPTSKGTDNATQTKKATLRDKAHESGTNIPKAGPKSAEDEETTPKMKPYRLVEDAPVPALNLNALAPVNNNARARNIATINRIPTISTASERPPVARSHLMPPPSRAPSSHLMPPPPIKPSALRPLPKLSGSLMPPPSAASSLRGGATITVNSLSATASNSTLPPAKRRTKKVVLEPGHSPMDWASLIKDPRNSQMLRGADLPPQLIRVTPSELKLHNGRKGSSAWGTYQGKVYNLTPYLKYHPGGAAELLRGAGKVGETEKLHVETHPWVNWDNMLGECLIGILVSEHSIAGQDLEAMD